MEEIGKIIELKDNIAVIEITPTDGCARCSQVNICHPAGKSKKTIELPNTINAQVNDWVKIEISEKHRALAIFLVLGLPILLLLSGVLVASYFKTDLLVFMGGTIGLLIGFIIVKIINNSLARKGKNLAYLKEKIPCPSDLSDKNN